MILGGSSYIIPVIDAAKKLGLYVITCDYLPNNLAHKYSDEYCNVSVMDKDAVLQAAQNLKIDGIISFACDPGVVAASYVAEKMGLPFQGSYNSVRILQDKGLFRKFLHDNNFNVPNAKRYIRSEINSVINDIDYFNWPVIVKPVDSAGSKGVTRIDSPDCLTSAINAALENSHCDSFIIEDFIMFDGYHSSTDPFTVDGRLKFITYSDQLFDSEAKNPYTPAFIIWPSTMKKEYQEILTSETGRLMQLLGMKTGIYNIETCVGKNGKPYIMEVSPRGGGCKIAELQKMAYGVDLIENEIRNSVGLPLNDIVQKECEGHWCEMVIHAGKEESGIFKALKIDKDIQEKYIKLVDLDVIEGDLVMPFTGANKSLGNIFLRFDSRDELNEVISSVKEWLKIELYVKYTRGGGALFSCCISDFEDAA